MHTDQPSWRRFQTCAESCALLESNPIAAVGGWNVVTVDYRQAQESVFPAASEDVAKVYGALLRAYRPEVYSRYQLVSRRSGEC
jgi:hypothetical protein